MPTSSAQAKAVAEYAQKKLNAKRFGILHPDSNYGEEMSRYFWDAVDIGCSEVRPYEHYPLRTTTVKPFVADMVGRSPDHLDECQQFSSRSQGTMKELKAPSR